MSNPTTIESAFLPLLAALSQLTRQLGRGSLTPEKVDEVLGMLETLPLSSYDFGIARNRLCNAQRYLSSNETGAAHWELRAMKQQLTSLAFAKAHVPRRRLRFRS